MATEFVYNPAFEAEVMAAPEMSGFVGDKAKAGAEFARSIAPVDTGAYRDSIDHEVVFEEGRWVGRIVAGTDHWLYLEVGTSQTPTFATLRKALDAVT